MAVTPQMVKELRDKTGAGMAECKKALDEAQGNMDEAIDNLRKRGAASVAKRADRSANEGAVVALTSADGTLGIMAEVNCETDFVARNEEFVAFTTQIGETLLAQNISTVEELMAQSAGDKTLNDLYNEILAKFSEKIGVKRFERRITSTGTVASYIHAGSKLGVLIETTAPVRSESGLALLRDIAMQVAAMKPLYTNRSNVNTEAIEKEIEIYKEQAIIEGKKPEIAEKVATGRLEKYYQENCLVEQAFVKDSNKTIKDVLKDISATEGNDVNLVSFTRYFLGEE